MGKAEKLRAELEVAEAEDAFVEAKSARRACSECGRTLPGSKKQEQKISEAKAIMRAARVKFRELREKDAAVT